MGAAPTTNFSYAPIMPQGTDIPGVAVGRNSTGRKVMWVGAYCGFPCTWPPGGVTEIDLCTQQTLVQHPGVGWGSTGPAGLAYDSRGFLWVASYNDKRIYKVRLSDFTLESSFPTPPAAGRPIGGLAFDGTYLWVASEGGLFKLDEAGDVTATYPIIGGGGLESADGFLFLVRLDGTVEARDLSFNLLQTYQFPPSAGRPDEHGDLGIDAESGEGYWSRRSLTQIYRMHLIDGLTGSACSPPPEVCDGIDNDGDGSIDEGNPGGGAACATGQAGVCGQGHIVCTGGSLQCRPLRGPSSEACDGLDNDCDGAVDEAQDSDGDGVSDCGDRCPGVYDLGQADSDGDGIGDACDCDALGPGVGDTVTVTRAGGAAQFAWSDEGVPGRFQLRRGRRGPNFPWDGEMACVGAPVSGTGTQDSFDPAAGEVLLYQVERIGCGGLCEQPNDDDGDGYDDQSGDNCPGVFNPQQADFDGDGRGDGCDNCAAVANHGQEDGDHDGIGDACDSDPTNSFQGTFEWEAQRVDGVTSTYKTVNFLPAFQEYPVVIASAEGATLDGEEMAIRNVTKGSFEVRISGSKAVSAHYFACTPGVWLVNTYLIYAMTYGGAVQSREITFLRPFPRTPAILATGCANANLEPQTAGVIYGLETLPTPVTSDLNAGTRGAFVGINAGTSPCLQVVAIASTGPASTEGTYTSGGSGSFKQGHHFESGFFRVPGSAQMGAVTFSASFSSNPVVVLTGVNTDAFNNNRAVTNLSAQPTTTSFTWWINNWPLGDMWLAIDPGHDSVEATRLK